ncbi:YceI family protein [Parvicella tangerina]|uniref:Protein YceI n=1 Tax=Parvicella tangerina TaxID=2829795 RepID=A0A916JLV1_9FLAO|nr:YceI family protein [Parvicella tangerina]CAG5080866.1 Protein YceI [Parvicella tangerina]
MRKLIFTLTFGLVLGVGAFAQSLKVDTENAKVEFKVVSEDVKGTLTGMEASIKFDANNLANSKIEGSIPVSTISTGNKTRDGHLQAEEYFYAEKYPSMEFESNQIEKTDNGFVMSGKMAIRGVTKEVRINFTYKEDKFEGKTIIYTNDFDFAVQKKREDSKVLVKFTVPVE